MEDAVGGGADRHMRGRMCSPGREVGALGEDLGRAKGVDEFSGSMFDYAG